MLTKNEQPDWGSEKGTRRLRVGETHRILLLLGDNLGDFVDGYKADVATRDAIRRVHAAECGRTWFALPNPTYGSWLDAIWFPERGLSNEAKTRRKLEAFDAWRPSSP